MTGSELMTVIGFFLTVSGAGWAIWWRIAGQIRSVEDKAGKVERELAAHRLHVAEAYATKGGLKEIKDEILGAVGGIRDDVRHLATRIDTMHEAQSRPRPTRRSAD